ncbi:NlpC/P60 family protein [Kitasatospora sp. NPDC058965]|uniref:C40 family peptidase n=1 Tax=Kitasatospora sp. NPDC058965 TaxID=3346682 RepID=UPI00367AD422
MASHRRPKPVGRTRASILTAAAATAVALSTQGAAHADPAPTLDQVKAQVDDLNGQAEAASQAYEGAQAKQQTLQKQVGDLQDQVARQQDQVTTLQYGLASVAADQYANGGISPTVQLMLNSHPDTFLTQAGSLNELNSSQTSSLKELQGEQRKLDQDKAEAQGKLAELDATTNQLKAAKDDVQAKLKKAQDLLNSLTEQQKQAIAAQEAKAAADAQAAAAKAAAPSQTASRDTTRPDLSAVPAGSHAQAAIAAAVSKLGSPYVYGATGPGTFDCSGLTQWAYAQAGVSLPRTSQEQASAGTNVGTNIANAQPGDLIVYFEDMHHVAIYVGGGQIIHAPHTGAVVRYESATVMPIAAIVRP